jgi:ribosomal peptide maturation radical SAM protein 1
MGVHPLPPMLAPGAGRRCAALLVVPPFAGVDRPSLGLHLLQANARQAGFEIAVFYANLWLAQAIGPELYKAISYAPTFWLLGERFFAKAAYGKTGLSVESLAQLTEREDLDHQVDSEALLAWCTQADRLADELAAVIAEANYPIVGFSTTFEQTAASMAMLDRVKALAPTTVAIVGGANCEGPMAKGVLSLSRNIDYVFSGESESSLLHFLKNWNEGVLPREKILTGDAVLDLGQLPVPDYQEYYDQLRTFIPEISESGDVWLPYESSRGCWWGVKHHCTFCGLNGQTMAPRTKPSSVVLDQLKFLLSKHPSRKISMVDNIMPHEYFKTLLPLVKSTLGDVHIFFEEKANLSLEQVLLLKSAGVNVIQPGIESLSTRVLKLMDKGVTARQNIELLRFAKACDLALNWNHLIGLPGDESADYWKVVDMIPALVHLNPPSGLSNLSIDRFSPYFERAEHHGVRAIEPMASYFDVLPDGADVFSVAYHFSAEYSSESRVDTELQKALQDAIGRWRDLWRQDTGAVPTLSVTPLDDQTFLLLDSRFNLSQPGVEFIDADQARMVLTGESTSGDATLQWARERRYVLRVDGRWTPLATASPETLSIFLKTRAKSLSIRLSIPIRT